jgi:hypothetical protein
MLNPINPAIDASVSGLTIFLPLDNPAGVWHSVSLDICLEDELESILSGVSDDLRVPGEEKEEKFYRVVNTEIYRKDNQIKLLNSFSLQKPFDWVIVVMVM